MTVFLNRNLLTTALLFALNTGLRQGLNALADKARELAQADATELVQRFGQLGQRRFHLAA